MSFFDSKKSSYYLKYVTQKTLNQTSLYSINSLLDHLKQHGLLSYFQHGFRSSHSTADLLIVLYYRVARTFNKSRPTETVALGTLKAFDRVWFAGLLHRFKSRNF